MNFINANQSIQEILNQVIWGNTLREIIQAILLFILSFVTLKVLRRIIVIKLRDFTLNTATKIDDLLISLVRSLDSTAFALISLNLSIISLNIPSFWKNLLLGVLTFVIAAYVASTGQKILIQFFKEKNQKAENKGIENEFDESMIQLFGLISNIIVWIVALLFIFSKFGLNLDTVLGTLGVGGIAIAFALQNVLSDIFASFSIYFDRPFAIGDFIKVEEDVGVVQKIGIKSSRIKTLRGEELVISNKELTEAKIHNFRKMQKRRIAFNIGVSYKTSYDQLREIPSFIKKIIEQLEICEFDRSHFKDFGSYSLNFETVYFILSNDYNIYMDIQQKINLEIKKIFEERDLEIAYPTQTVILAK